MTHFNRNRTHILNEVRKFFPNAKLLNCQIYSRNIKCLEFDICILFDTSNKDKNMYIKSWNKTLKRMDKYFNTLYGIRRDTFSTYIDLTLMTKLILHLVL